MTPERLLTAAEVADLLRIPLHSAYRLGREGRLPGVVRLGRVMRFSPTAVSAYVAAGGSAGDHEPELTPAA